MTMPSLLTGRRIAPLCCVQPRQDALGGPCGTTHYQEGCYGCENICRKYAISVKRLTGSHGRRGGVKAELLSVKWPQIAQIAETACFGTARTGLLHGVPQPCRKLR